jgi:UMF1 family MFS transporter
MMPPYQSPAQHRDTSMNAKEWAWASYDIANSAFPTIISTFVIATYFTASVAASPVEGQAMWAWMQALVGLTVGLLSPVLGAVADAGGRRRGMLLVLTLLTALATAMIWFIRPEPGYAVTALLLVGIASIGFELGTVFYNAMLPGVARPEAMGRVSGIGWAMGYGGGLVCLALCLVLLVQPDPALFGLNREAGEHIRATALLVGAWMMIFCWPVLIAVRDPVQRPPIRQAISTGLSEIARLLRSLPREPVLARFLLARLFYTDGLNTLFAFGAI